MVKPILELFGVKIMYMMDQFVDLTVKCIEGVVPKSRSLIPNPLTRNTRLGRWFGVKNESGGGGKK